MPLVENATIRKLRSGGLALGFGVHHLRSAAAGMLAAATGHDWLFIDMEHGAFLAGRRRADLHRRVADRHHPDRAHLRRRARSGHPRARQRRRSASSSRMSIPSIRPGTSPRPFAIRRWGRGAGADHPPCSATRRPRDAEAQAAINPEILVVAMIESAEGARQCRWHCRGRRDRRIADRNLRPDRRDGHFRTNPHPRVEDAYRSVGAACRKARQISRHGRRLRIRISHEALHRSRCALHPDGIGSRLHSGRRHAAVGFLAKARSRSRAARRRRGELKPEATRPD